MELRLQIVSIVGSALLLLVVLELVRSRRLLERYALAWLFSALVLLGLALWKGLLVAVADAVGIFSPPNALFLIAFGFVMALLLNFSVAVSRLSDQAKVLAQRLALLEERQARAERASPARSAAPAQPEDGEQERGEEDLDADDDERGGEDRRPLLGQLAEAPVDPRGEDRHGDR